MRSVCSYLKETNLLHVGVDWEHSHCQLAVSLSVLVLCATFAEVPTSGHSAASYVSSVSGCVFAQKLFHFTERLLCALPQSSDADFYKRKLFSPHFTLLFLFVRFVHFTDSPVTTVNYSCYF